MFKALWKETLAVVGAVAALVAIWNSLGEWLIEQPLRLAVLFLAAVVAILVWVIIKGQQDRKKEAARASLIDLQADIELLQERLSPHWMVGGKIYDEWLVQGPFLPRLPAEEHNVVHDSLMHWEEDVRTIVTPELEASWERFNQSTKEFYSTYTSNAQYEVSKSSEGYFKGPLDDDFSTWQKIHDKHTRFENEWRNLLAAYDGASRTLRRKAHP